MGQATFPVGVVETSGEQLSLSSTLASLGIPPNCHQARIYVPSTDYRLHLNPAILALYFYDASASAGSRWKTLRPQLQDRDTATGSGTILDNLATADYLYVCTNDIIGGLRVVMTASVNANLSRIAGGYLKNDSTWATLSTTDGTVASGSKSLSQTGSITWTVPTDFMHGTLQEHGAITDIDAPGIKGVWVRFNWDTLMSADVEVAEMWTLNENTNRGYYYKGCIDHFSLDLTKVGAVEALLASGTDTMDITWIRTIR